MPFRGGFFEPFDSFGLITLDVISFIQVISQPVHRFKMTTFGCFSI